MTAKALRDVLLIESLLAFASTMISPFISIFLYRTELGYISIGNFYGISFAWTVVFCVLFSWFPVTNARLAISASSGVLMAYYLSIFFLPPPWLFIISPLIYALYVMLFWLPFNFIFCDLTSKGDRGMTIGITFLVFPIIQLITPLFAGSLISTLGYAPVFGISAIILAANTILPSVLLKGSIGKISQKARLDFKPFGWQLSTSLVVQGMQDGTFFYLIPLVSLYLTGGEFGVGLAQSVFAVGGAAAAVVVARISDRSGDRVTWLRAGALASVPLFLLVWIFPTLLVFMICIGVAQLTTYMVSIFVMTMAIDKNETHKPTALLTRELLLEAGRALGVVALSLTWMLWHDLFLGLVVTAICIGASAIAK